MNLDHHVGITCGCGTSWGWYASKAIVEYATLCSENCCLQPYGYSGRLSGISPLQVMPLHYASAVSYQGAVWTTGQDVQLLHKARIVVSQTNYVYRTLKTPGTTILQPRSHNEQQSLAALWTRSIM